MGWEQYLSAETLYNTTSSELEQIKNDLQREMNRRIQSFDDYKKWMMNEFEQVFIWYQRHYSQQTWLEVLEDEFNAKLEKTSSVEEMVKIFDQISRNADIPIKLCDMLKSKYSLLCIAGKLPRDFILQIRPLVILETQQSYVNFLNKVNGVFGKAKSAQVEVFETLIRKLSIVENEDEARESIKESISVIKSFLDKKNTFSLFDQIGNKHLCGILLKLLHDLEKRGYLYHISIVNFDLASLREAIDIAEAQIVLKKLNQQEQMVQLILAHKLAFSLLQTSLQGNKEIQRFLIIHAEKLSLIAERVSAKDASGLMFLHENYIKFWLDITYASLEEIARQAVKKNKRWLNMHMQILNARKNLYQQGYLPKDFVLDHQYLIISCFESYIYTAYRNSFWKPSDDRLEQIDYIRKQLKSVNSATQAARIIHIAIEDIQQDHQMKSIGFNLTFLKKKSRAAGALQALLRDCERDNILPKIVIHPANPIEQYLAEIVEQYFAADIIFSNREHRAIANRLFSAIRLVEDQIYEQKIMLIDGQQLIADLLLQATKEAKKTETKTYLVKKLLSFLGKRTNPAFVEYLKRAQMELIINKKLVESYRYVIWPILKENLNETISAYQNNLTTPLEENKYIGAKEAYELLVQLHDATNAEQACYLLAYGIRSLHTGFPLLAAKLEGAYQVLRKDGVLPAIPQTEFSETIKKQIKQQTREITELRARLCKIS